MRQEGWFGRLWTRIKTGVVQDVPPGLEECETCREVDCTQERWLRCERRLAAEDASLAAAGTSTGRTDELPGISSIPELPEPLSEPRNGDPAASYEQAETFERRRKISSH